MATARDWETARRRIWELTESVTGGATSQAFSCLYFAAATGAALRGSCAARFTAGGACLGADLLHAWGLIVNPRDQTYTVTADRGVDDADGSFCGHCWVEVGPVFDATVVDVVTGYVGPRVDKPALVVYHPVAALKASIRKVHGPLLDRVAKEAARDPLLKTFFRDLL